jgi:BirA family transcriptional regulator, biotin operon repressor / biotin---[acetyl-CoA-carboxylase] ligase
MIGTPRVHHRRTDSTNERARELAMAGAPHGTLVTADEQTAGRGRQGRTWLAPPGSAVLMSVVIRDFGAADVHLPLAAAVAVCESCERAAAVSCRIKWPNDVWIDGRKVAGILIEGRPQEGWAVLGIGVNVSTAADEFADEIRQIATSLRASDPNGNAPTSEGYLELLLGALEAELNEPPEAVVSHWRPRDALFGSDIRWQSGEGVARGIDEAGSLIVETASGRVFLDSGEVHLVR